MCFDSFIVITGWFFGQNVKQQGQFLSRTIQQNSRFTDLLAHFGIFSGT